MMMIVVVILTAVMIVIVVVIVTAVMAMKTPEILKMRPLWKIGSALLWHSVSMSVYKHQIFTFTDTHTYKVDPAEPLKVLARKLEKRNFPIGNSPNLFSHQKFSEFHQISKFIEYLFG